jgi:hypothetical protein
MARRGARTTYRVTTCAGGTVYHTPSRARAIAHLNRMAFPGDVIRCLNGVDEETIELELNEDGQWVEKEPSHVRSS